MLHLDFRRIFRSFDWTQVLLISIISAIGLLTVFSATYRPEQPFSLFFKKQAFGLLSGFLIYGVCALIDFRALQRFGYFFYFCISALLMFTIIKGSISMGGQRWINLGFIKFQPSELAKLFFPAFFSYYLLTERKGTTPLMRWVIIISVLLMSMLLILKQPDLGTSLILLFTGIALLWIAGVSHKFFIIAGLSVLITAPITWHFLKPYQRQRIAVFLGEGESRKERYQIEQSHIAIGSGGFWGKGFLQGTQNKLQFLPEGRTDFIFSVFCEEWGFLGALLILLLYGMLFFRLFETLITIENYNARLLATGLVIHVLISTLINIGMVLGLMPIVGIPLPFMTYGITHLWITFASLGWFTNIITQRYLMTP